MVRYQDLQPQLLLQTQRHQLQLIVHQQQQR